MHLVYDQFAVLASAAGLQIVSLSLNRVMSCLDKKSNGLQNRIISGRCTRTNSCSGTHILRWNLLINILKNWRYKCLYIFLTGLFQVLPKSSTYLTIKLCLHDFLNFCIGQKLYERSNQFFTVGAQHVGLREGKDRQHKNDLHFHLLFWF